jgi:cytochrome c-type biogenesis protein CcmH/NrfG
MSSAQNHQHLEIRHLLKQGRIGDALAALELLLAANPDDGRAHALLGKLLMRDVGDYAQAESAFRSALRFSPALPALYYDFAELLIRMDKPTETIAVLNKALEVQGIEKERIHRMMGQVFEREQRWSDAVDSYTRAVMHSLSESFVQECHKDMLRVRMKMQLR